MELTGYLTVARRWWWTLLVAAWVAALSGYLVASRITPTYEAQVQLLVGPINTDSDTLRASGLLVQTYATLAIGPGVLQSAAQELGGVDPVKLAPNVRATASDVTRVLQIRVQDADPAHAASIANTMANELIQLTTGATTRPEGQLQVIAPAVPPTVPIAPQVSLIVLLAAAAGLLGGLFLVIVVEYATDSVRDRADLARLVPVSVLSTVSFEQRTPRADPVPVTQAVAPGSDAAVAFRLLAAKIAFAANDRPTRSTLVTSLRDGDGAVVAINVAAAMAASGHRVVVVDGSADGDLTRVLDMSNRRGLSDLLAAGDDDLRGALASGPAGVRVLPQGTAGSVELVAVERVRTVLDALLQEADLVVVDGGAIQHSAGVLTWARATEETVLVVRRGSTRRDELRLAAESLRFVDANVGGTVLVQRPVARPGLRRGGARRAGADAQALEGARARTAGLTRMETLMAAPTNDGGVGQTTSRQTSSPAPSGQPPYSPPVTIPSIVAASRRPVTSDQATRSTRRTASTKKPRPPTSAPTPAESAAADDGGTKPRAASRSRRRPAG